MLRFVSHCRLAMGCDHFARDLTFCYNWQREEGGGGVVKMNTNFCTCLSITHLQYMEIHVHSTLAMAEVGKKER